MKRYIAGTLAFLAATAFATTSCYKDHSTQMSATPPAIATTTPEGLSYEFMQEVDWSPILAFIKGSQSVEFTEQDYADYDYTWRITRTNNPYDTTRITIGQGRALQTTIGLPPNTAAEPYDLGLYMKHKTTGMQNNIHWSVDVSSQLAGGVLVADTRDEQTSDLSLIKSCFYTTTMWDIRTMKPREDIIYRNIYSAANQAPFDGVVSSIAFNGNSDFSEVAAVVRGRSLTRMDPISMKATERDGEMFYYQPETWNPQAVYSLPQNTYQRMVLINDGRAHFYNPKQCEGKYSSSTDQDYGYEIAEGVVVPFNIYTNVYSLYFDKKNGRIITLNAQDDYTAANADDLPDPAEGSNFNYKDLGGFDCLWAGYFYQTQSPGLNEWAPDTHHGSIWLMREKSSGKLWIYEMTAGEADATGDWDFQLVCRGVARFDMSGCEGLTNATCWACSQNCREFYYAVGNKIYAVILTPGATPVSKVVFETTGADEEITHMDFDKCMYGGYTYWSYRGPDMPLMQMSFNNLMTIATWNASAKEGKVYAIPRRYAGDGLFAARTFVREWGGFGRITAICVRE